MEEEGDEVAVTAKVHGFDRYDVAERCKELMRRLCGFPEDDQPTPQIPCREKDQCGMLQWKSVACRGSPQWKWDILELMEESHHQLRDIRKVHSDPDRGIWQETAEILERRKIWLGDFDTELTAILARGKEVRERLLFEDMDRASWFSAAGVSGLEVQRLLERHQEMHQRAGRFARQLKLLSRGLQQQGALSSRNWWNSGSVSLRNAAAKTVGEKLQSSLVCLAAVAVAPVPGSSEMWLATTTMMWLDKDQAWQHVVYEHPRDADTDTILDQFQCRSSKAEGVEGHL
eukprot:s565_g15.t1